MKMLKGPEEGRFDMNTIGFYKTNTIKEWHP
jgi:hypothetical protein